jgi:quercetin 2,3-dioxygenase
MIRYRAAKERGQTQTSWLRSFHSFSFSSYYDARHTRFGPLRVLNDDCISGGGGFPMHPHRDMEILTWVVEGALEHRDSTGGHGVIHAGELQRMTAGSGVYHSEFNHSPDRDLRLLQIWIEPSDTGLEPDYEQHAFDAAEYRNRLLEVASGPEWQGVLRINQDARMFVAAPGKDVELRHALAERRGAYCFVIDGRVHAGDVSALQGDALIFEDEVEVRLRSEGESSLLLFDMPL